MRKIEERMIAAIRNGANWCSGNTSVTHVLGGGGAEIEVRLHGHLIAKWFAARGWEISLCGWNTPTTRSRLSAIVREFSVNGGRGLGVSTRKGIPYLHDARGSTEIDEDGTHPVRIEPVS